MKQHREEITANGNQKKEKVNGLLEERLFAMQEVACEVR